MTFACIFDGIPRTITSGGSVRFFPTVAGTTNEIVTVGATPAYYWEFGDGDTSTLATPIHEYPATASPEAWDVRLTVCDASGATCDYLIENFITSESADNITNYFTDGSFLKIAVILRVPTGSGSVVTGTYEGRVVADTDDCFLYVPDSNVNTTGLMVMGDSGGSCNTGIRWCNVDIPHGATINTAYVTFSGADDCLNETCTISICGEANDNPITFSTYEDFVAREVGLISVPFVVPPIPSDVVFNSPEIKSVIQEIVYRAGWSSGNSLVLFFNDNGSSGYAQRNIADFGSYPLICPLLHIEYSSGSGPTPPPNLTILTRNGNLANPIKLLNVVSVDEMDRIGTLKFTVLDTGDATQAQINFLQEKICVTLVCGTEVEFDGVIRRVTKNSQCGYNSPNRVNMWDVECDSDLAILKQVSVDTEALTSLGSGLIDTPGYILRRVLTTTSVGFWTPTGGNYRGAINCVDSKISYQLNSSSASEGVGSRYYHVNTIHELTNYDLRARPLYKVYRYNSLTGE